MSDNNEQPRKASEVILELEGKVSVLLKMVEDQNFNIKLLSDKINSVLEAQRQILVQTQQSQLQQQKSNMPVIEAVNTSRQNSVKTVVQQDVDRNIYVNSANQLPLETAPKGFRRTSRPETYAGDDAVLDKKQPSQQKPASKAKQAEIIVPNVAKTPLKEEFIEVSLNHLIPDQSPEINAIPVKQRVIDTNGKSVFMAEVEVIGKDNFVFKTRTNGTGKWMASLLPGEYTVFIRKIDSLSKSKAKKENKQDIYIDGKQSPLELNQVIFN